MRFISTSTTIAAALILAATGASSTSAQGPRPTAVDRYGIGGHIQAIGLHHGFHVETVALDSPAAKDHLRAHDVIVKVDGEPIRSLEHLRAMLAEAFMDDGEVTMTYLRTPSLEHRILKGHLKGDVVKPVTRRRRPVPEDDDVR